MPTRLALAAGWLALLACQTRSALQEVPALITEPSAESRAELVRVLGLALHGAPLTIAEDALTRDSTLIIEPVRPRDASGVPLSGRELGRPERFRLLKSGSSCVLVQESSGRRWTLTSTTCSAP